jgi:phosphatidylglycerophosphatase A
MKKKIVYFIATGFGSGYAPFASGTAGSLAALVVYILVPLSSWFWLFLSILTLIVGIYVASLVENDVGKDPKIVVIDEFVGQWLALLFLPRTWGIYVAAFFLFRVLDITKPYPANRIEKIKGGRGIMLDDVVAGLYANIIMQIIYRLVL